MKFAKKSLSLILTLSLILSLTAGLTIGAGAASDFDPAKTTPTPTAASAFDFKDGTITGYTGEDTNVVIPAEIDGTTVTKIDTAAFWYGVCTDTLIKSVVIPSTVTDIGDYAFDEQTDLTDIYFYGDTPAMTADTLESSDGPSDATVHCKAKYYSNFNYEISYLTLEMDIAANLADPAYVSNDVVITATAGSNGTISPADKVKVEKGKSQTFTFTPADGYQVKAVLVDGESVSFTNNSYTFTNVQDKHTIYVTFCSTDPVIAAQEGFSFEIRDDQAWIKGYTGDGGDITLPTQYKDGDKTYDVVGVAKEAFSAANGSVTGVKEAASLAKITKITVPEGIKAIEAKAFLKVGKYSSANEDGYQLKEIVFEDADTKFVGETTASSVINSQLSGNPKLAKVTLPANLTEIPSSLFSDDKALETITIPQNVTKVGQRAFEGCTALKTVTFKSKTAPTMEVYEYSSTDKRYPFKDCDVTVVVPLNTGDSYTKAWADMLTADVSKRGAISIREEGGNVYFTQFTVGDIDYRVVDLEKRTAEVKKVNTNSGNKFNPSGTLTIPEKVEVTKAGVDFEFTIVGIGEKAMDFMGYSPSTYVSTSYWFANVEFPDTLQYIGKWGCAGLEGVKTIDLSNTQVTSIGDFAFNNCGSVEIIKLPDTLKDLGMRKEKVDSSDDDMTGGSAQLPDGVDPGEDSNTDAAEKPAEDTTQATDNVFRGCQKLRMFEVNETNPYFSSNDGVLFNKAGTKLIRYPVGRSVAKYAIPEGTEVIAEAAFMQIAGTQKDGALKSVTFPSTLKKIEDGAFRQSSLTSVTLLAGVEYGSYVFDISTNLKTVEVQDGVTAIPEKAFWACSALTNINFPDSVKTIGESAFERTGLTTIDLNKVEYIGNYAFYGAKFQNLTIPAQTKSGTGAFMNCRDLTDVTIADGATELGRYMFYYCTSMENVTLPESLQTINEFALAYCAGMENLTIPNSVTTIGGYAFRNCLALKSITLPTGLKTMGNGVFTDCAAMETATFPDNIGVTTVPKATFYECLNLKTVNLGDSISSTEPLSFYLAGWYNGFKVTVNANQPEEFFFRNEFDTCFIDLGASASDNEDKATDEMTYIWLNTTEGENGLKVYTFKAKAGGGCGGGCGGGGAADEDGFATYTMEQSTTLNFNYAAKDNGTPSAERMTALKSLLPTVITVNAKTGDNGAEKNVANYSLSDLESLAQKDTKGYQYVGMRGWAVMATTEYVSLNQLLGGESFGPGDKLVITSDDYVFTITYEDLQKASSFFPDAQSKNEKKDNRTTTNPQDASAVLALSWNTSPIEDGDNNDQAAVNRVARTAYKSTNLRFACGLDAESYNAMTDNCEENDKESTFCSGYRLLQRVQSLTVVHAKSGGNGGNTGDKTPVMTINTKAGENGTEKTVASYTTSDLETMAKANKGTQGYQYITKKGWSVMAATEYVTLNQLLDGESFGSGDSLVVKASDDATYTVTYDELQKHSSFFPNAQSVAGTRDTSGAVDVDPILALTWDTGTISSDDANDQAALDRIAQSAKNSGKLRFAFGLNADEYTAMTDLNDDSAKFCRGQRLLSNVVSITVVQAKNSGGNGGNGGGNSTIVVPTPKDFTDVPANSYYADAVDWAVKQNITTGTSSTTFSPDENCTRAQVVTFLWRAAGSPESTANIAFTDVKADAYYAKAVAWAVENKITTGTTDTTFEPEAVCTRAQVATFLWRAAKSPAATAENLFTDVKDDAYYAKAVAWAVEKKITAGTDASHFSPDENCTRAQIVTFLFRNANSSK